MKINKPKFWEKDKSFLSYLLFPISLIIIGYIYLKKRIIKKENFKIPVVCIGNIYLGGTGKTPTSIFIANEFFKQGKKPVIIRKYYKSHTDEHRLIKAYVKNLILSKNRAHGILEAEKKNFDVAILDDGFQDYKIKKDLNIICFNGKQLVGNGYVLPAGPLRENLNALKNANIILINGEKNINFENKIKGITNNIDIFYSFYRPTNLNEFKNKNLLAIAGIGNPINFFNLIEKNNLKVKERLIFPDHYTFSTNEIKKIIHDAKNKNLHIIMTEKDFYKTKHFNFKELKCLKVSLEINEKEKFLKKIYEFYNQKF